jgi:EmrB/QacA subfamily drug resistance transporter
MPANTSAQVTRTYSSPVATPARDRRGDAIRLSLILVAAFMVVLDFSIVNVALPSIERELHVTDAVTQWVVTGYAIAFGGLLILGGRAADLLGRRRMFVAGLVVFSLASLAGGLAHDPTLLIASRVIQGAGAALVAPAALSLITTTFPEGAERTRAIGLYGCISSIGFVAGQVLGGVIVEYTSWRWVFLVNVPVGLVAAFLAPRPRILGRGGATRRQMLDLPGAVLITASVAFLVYGVSEGTVRGWTSWPILATFTIAVAAVLAFGVAENHHPQPLIRPRLLRRPGLRNGTVIAFLLGLWNGGEMLLMSLYLQQALHFSPLATGMVIAPQGVAGFVTGLLGPRLASRIGIRRLLVLTAGATAVGFAVLTRLPASGYSPVLIVVLLVGFGTAGTAFGSIVLASRGMADADQGLVGGMINTSRQIGAAVGAALLPAIAESVSHDGGVSGYRAAMFTAGLAALLATAEATTGGITGITGDRLAMVIAAVAALAATAVAWHASRVPAATLAQLLELSVECVTMATHSTDICSIRPSERE